MSNSAVVSDTTPSGPLVDQNGKATFAFLKWLQNIGRTVNDGFDQNGAYQGNIGTHATIAGRSTLATIVQNISDAGVVQPVGLPSATDALQGAVILPPGAVGHTLGSAAMRDATAFDPAGAAAAAQAAAATDATTKATAAQSNAEAFATASIATAFSPGISVTITTAPLTGLGSTGSMTFTNGLLTAQTPAT